MRQKSFAARLIHAVIFKNAGLGFPVQLISRTRHRQSRVRRAASRKAVRARVHRVVAPFAWLFMLVSWPVFVALYAARMPKVQRDGHSRLTIAWVSFTANIAPQDLLHFRHLDRPRREIDDWIETHENIALMAFMRKRVSNGDMAWEKVINDKIVFARFCRDHELPHPDVRAAWLADRSMVEELAGDPNEEFAGDLVLKPAGMAAGKGVELWERQADAPLWSHKGGPACPMPFVLARGEALARTAGGAILQECVASDPAVELPGPIHAPTVRAIIGTWPSGEIEIFSHHLSYPPPGGFTTNDSYGQFSLGIELETGRITPQLLGTSALEDSGESLVGTVLKRWDETAQILKRAHACAPSNAIILGWDFIVSARGPKILETNLAFGATAAQTVFGQPMGRARLGDFYAAWIEHIGI